MIEFNKVKKSFQYKIVLHDVDFVIEKSSIFAFVGKNGSGKTTTFKMMLGLLKQDSGDILINGEKVSTIKKDKTVRIGFIPDKFEINEKYNLYEYLTFYAECFGFTGLEKEKQVDKVLNKLFLTNRKKELVETFSKGTKSIVALARALLANPDILILDEATDGLDTFTKQEFKNIMTDLKEQGKTIVLSSHQLSDIKDFATHIGIIEHNTVSKYGKVEDILKGKDFQKKLCVQIDENIEDAQKFLKNNPLVFDLMINGDRLHMTFLGNKNDEIEILKNLVNNNYKVRSFGNYYEHNYDY